MREAQTKTIDGITFEVTPLGFATGRKAFVRLSKAVGPALAAAAGSGGALDVTGQDVDVVGALSALVDRISDEDLEWFADVLGKTTRFSRHADKWPHLLEANRELLFAGRILLFFQWLMFALEVNYSDFFTFLKSATAGGDLAAPADPEH